MSKSFQIFFAVGLVVYVIIFSGRYWLLRFGLFGRPHLMLSAPEIVLQVLGAFLLLAGTIRSFKRQIAISLLVAFVSVVLLLIGWQAHSRQVLFKRLFRDYVYEYVPKDVRIMDGSFYSFQGTEVSLQFKIDEKTLKKIIVQQQYQPIDPKTMSDRDRLFHFQKGAGFLYYKGFERFLSWDVNNKLVYFEYSDCGPVD